MYENWRQQNHPGKILTKHVPRHTIQYNMYTHSVKRGLHKIAQSHLTTGTWSTVIFMNT